MAVPVAVALVLGVFVALVLAVAGREAALFSSLAQPEPSLYPGTRVLGYSSTMVLEYLSLILLVQHGTRVPTLDVLE